MMVQRIAHADAADNPRNSLESMSYAITYRAYEEWFRDVTGGEKRRVLMSERYGRDNSRSPVKVQNFAGSQAAGLSS